MVTIPRNSAPRHVFRILFSHAAAIFLILVGARIAVSSSADASASYKIVGYYPSWAAYARGYTPRSIDPTRFTHLVYAFGKIDKGEVSLNDDVVDSKNIAELQALKQRNERLRLLIAVGGWAGSADFSDIAASDIQRRRFAESAAAFVRAHNFDGIDIDWEYPVAGGREENAHRPADRENLTLVLEATREALDTAGRVAGRRYLLTIAVGASTEHVANLDIERIARIVDWVGVMSYDFSGAWSKTSGHNAPLAFDPNDPTPGAALNPVSAAVARHLAAGLPRSKLLLGLPLYGRIWQGCEARNDGEYQVCAGPGKGTWEDGVLDNQDIAQTYATDPAFTRHVNRAAKAPFLFDAASGHFISYDDAESFHDKLSFLTDNGLAGVMLWELSADRKDVLIDLVARELGAR